MIDVTSILSGYDQSKLTVGVLGGHSALDVCHGAKKHGFKTVCVAKKGRSNTYEKYYKACIDDVIVKPSFENVLDDDVQKTLQEMNTIFVHNRYFWVYFDDFSKVENDFNVPIFGSRSLLKIEERDQPYNQYHLLQDAGIRTPKIFEKPEDMDGTLCIIKANEAARSYERAFFFAGSKPSYEKEAASMIKNGQISEESLSSATIEEFIPGAQVNFNFFYSPLTDQLELMGTDTRRQTNLDGILRLPANMQEKALKKVPLKWIETGHIAVTVKESILEKAFDLGEKFVAQCKKFDGTGIIGPFALQGAVNSEEGKEDIVIFDVSFRIPGSPGTFATPYSRYLHGDAISVGERIGMEITAAVDANALEKVVT